MRLREHTVSRPKPMVEIGGRPILWHIMKTYAHYGVTDFVLCLGYKGDMIKDYFLHYEARNCDLTVTLGASSAVEIHGSRHGEDGWRVTLTDTGEDAMTGAPRCLIRGRRGRRRHSWWKDPSPTGFPSVGRRRFASATSLPTATTSTTSTTSTVSMANTVNTASTASMNVNTERL